MTLTRRRLLIGALLIALLAGAVAGVPRLLRLLPLVTEDNTGAERVVLLHGLGRTERAMLLLEGELVAAGYEVHSLGYPSREQSPEELLAGLTPQITACCELEARTIHFVGHSMGGLMIRAYLAEFRPPQLGRVVLIGTPNGGSELADVERHGAVTGYLLERAGPSALALGTGEDDFPARLPPPDYPVGVIAGTRGTALGDTFLPVPNDGMVSVESTRLEGMADFMTLDATHWGLRNDARVADAVVSFLRTGRFGSGPPES